MYNLNGLILEYPLSAEEILIILNLPLWHLENGLKHYQFNDPMREHLRKEIEIALASPPRT